MPTIAYLAVMQDIQKRFSDDRRKKLQKTSLSSKKYGQLLTTASLQSTGKGARNPLIVANEKIVTNGAKRQNCLRHN